MSRLALGRGLEALIPTAATPSPSTQTVQQLPVEAIVRNPHQPRTQFDPAGLQELTDSIRAHGVLQPILVKHSDDKYQIVAGERRWLAAKSAGLSTVPAIVVDHLDPATEVEWALVENLQREDLNALDEAAGYKKLVELFGYTHEQIAAKVGKDRSTVANALRLLALPDSIRDKIAAGRLTAGHARALLGLPHAHQQVKLAARIVAESLSVRKVEEIVYGRPKRATSHARKRSPELEAVERKLRQKLGATVHVIESGKRGRIIIDYYGHQDLNRVLDVMGIV